MTKFPFDLGIEFSGLFLFTFLEEFGSHLG